MQKYICIFSVKFSKQERPYRGHLLSSPPYYGHPPPSPRFTKHMCVCVYKLCQGPNKAAMGSSKDVAPIIEIWKNTWYEIWGWCALVASPGQAKGHKARETDVQPFHSKPTFASASNSACWKASQARTALLRTGQLPTTQTDREAAMLARKARPFYRRSPQKFGNHDKPMFSLLNCGGFSLD